MRIEKGREKNKSRLIAGVFSFLFAAALMFGARLDSVENVNVKDGWLWIGILVLTVIFSGLLPLCWRLLDLLREKLLTEKKSMPNKITSVFEWTDHHIVFVSFFVLFLCWLPVFLAVYPGFFVYDANDEFVQMQTRLFSTHHPLAHVLFLGVVISGVHKLTDSYNLGIACYTLLQMALVAGGFAFLFWYLREKKVHRGLRLFGLLYLGLFPTVVMFTLCSAKDGLFTTALLLLLICLLEMGMRREAFFSSKGWRLLFVLSGAAMMLLRNNGIYAFVVLIPFLLCFQKKQRKQTFLLAVLAVAGCLLVNGGLKAALHAEGGEYQEILTVPIQQLARAYHYAPEAFSAEDVAILHEVLSEEALAHYVPRCSDQVKYRFDNAAFAKDKARYMGLWLRVGLKKPLVYLNAWWMTSYGFWFPDTVINVYGGNTVFTFTYQDNSYFGYEVEAPGVRESKIPWLDEVYRKLSLEIWKEKIPIISWLFSPGAMFWFYAFLFTWFLNNGRYEMLTPFLLVFLLWMTVLLGPTYLPRYVVVFWYGLPLFLGMTVMEPEKEAFVVKKG